MVDGDFYDASAYKANPIPMALDSGTVYEAERSGKSLGLFTVTNALQGPNHTWAGAGTWTPEGSKPASAGRRAANKPRDIESEDGPPVLRRRQPKEKPAEPATPAATTPASPAQTSPASPAPAKGPAETPSIAADTPPPSVEEDPDRPTLKRGVPPPSPQKPSSVSGIAPARSSPAAATPQAVKGEKTEIQIIPAISDAGGPQPSSFIYPTKPDDEQQFRKRILAMAASEITAHAKELASETATTPHPAARRKMAAAKSPQPTFDNVQLRVLDPASSNEPVLVLSAIAHMPESKTATQPRPPYTITLVARQDIYGDLHKVFSNITDAQHLDITPRYDFIDIVDADGDGRGELLFRKVSDSARAFTVFRIIGNQLWPLFDGTLGSQSAVPPLNP